MKKHILIVCLIIIGILGILFISLRNESLKDQEVKDLILQNELKRLEAIREIRGEYERQNQECRLKGYKDCTITLYL